MTAKELKASILDLAVRGKLVPQDPNDEPASVLLEKIRAEKRKLVKAGKIKKEKNPSEIYIAADGKPYEKFADGSETCIEDEIPFELPKGWAWARLGELCLNVVDCPHTTPIKSSLPTEYPCIRTSEIKGGIIRWDTMQYVPLAEYEKRTARLVPKTDDLVYAREGSFGDAVLLPPRIKFCLGQRTMLFRFLKDMVLPRYMLFAIISPYVYGQAVALNVAGTTNVPHVNIGDAIRFTIPLPPLNEQRRIISLIETLLDKVNEYDNISNVLLNLDTALPLLIKKSILQYAVEGKLVPQDPNDEPASALVERIAEERKALVKAGKLKQDKNESVIFRGADRLAYETRNGETVCIEDELPFKIPETWSWVRFNSFGTFVGGHTPSLADHANWEYGSVLWITSKDMKSKYIVESGEKLSPKGARELQLLPPETILMVTRSGILKHTFPVAIAKKPLTINQDQRALRLYFPEMSEFVYVLLRGLESRVLRDFVKKGTTVQSILWDKFINMSIPLPPIAEQERIVSEVERLEKQVARLQ